MGNLEQLRKLGGSSVVAEMLAPVGNRNNPIDDRSAEVFHRRSKEVLDGVLRALQQHNGKPVSSVDLTQNGYVQRYELQDVRFDVAVKPTEPAEVDVVFHVNPPRRFMVDVMSADRKTIDSEVIVNRVAAGVTKLIRQYAKPPKVAYAATPGETPKGEPEKPPEKEPEKKPEKEPPPKKELEKPAAGKPPVKKPMKKEASASRLQQLRAKMRESAVEYGRTQMIPKQVMSRAASVVSRMSKNGSFPAEVVEIGDSMLASLRKNDVERAAKAALALQDAIQSKERDEASKVELSGIEDEIVEVARTLSALSAPMQKLRQQGVQTEKVMAQVGAQRSGLGGTSMSRTAEIRFVQVKEANVGSKDSFNEKLSPTQKEDFVQLFSEALRSFLPGIRFKFMFQPALEAWAVMGKDWGVSIRTNIGKDGWDNDAYGEVAVRRKWLGTIRRLGKFTTKANDYASMAINLAMKVSSVLKSYDVAYSEKF